MKQIKNDDNFVRAPADGVVDTASSKTVTAPGKSNIQAENAQRKIELDGKEELIGQREEQLKTMID